MSEQLPYKDEQWNELPLPDSETSWQKMELLLDKDKKRRVPFWWWRYAALAFLLAGVGTGGWLWLSSGDKKTESARAVNQNITVPKEESEDVVSNKREVKTPANSSHENTSIILDGSQQKKAVENAPQVLKTKTDKSVALVRKENNTRASQKAKTKSLTKTKTPSETEDSENSVLKKDKGNPVIVSTGTKINSTDSIAINKEVKKESINTKDSAKAIIAPPIVSKEDKKEEKKTKSSLVWSAGIGFQQSIALQAQQVKAVDSLGKRYFFDYFPSAYLRVQKDRWFAQAEFHFSVPQPVQNFAFSQKTTFNSSNFTVNTEKFFIQKLYYHQLPVSINYFVLPNLSVGAGGVYNVLAGAVTQQEITTKNVMSGAETVSKAPAPVKGYKDSFLYKTTAGLILQTDYHWKRFSLGMRFTQNLQPFIKYTKPDGTIWDENSNALQAMLRFRLWSK